MTAYPVTCIVDLSDGYRTSITIEDGDAESGSLARITIQSEQPAATLRIELSPEAVRAIIDELSTRDDAAYLASPLAGDPTEGT